METRSYDRRGTFLVQFLRCLGVFLKFVAVWSVVIFHVFETRKCSSCSPNYWIQPTSNGLGSNSDWSWNWEELSTMCKLLIIGHFLTSIIIIQFICQSSKFQLNYFYAFNVQSSQLGKQNFVDTLHCKMIC